MTRAHAAGHSATRGAVQDIATRRARIAVLGAAMVALIGKLLMAGLTYGTEDVNTWKKFAVGVHERGPIGVYSIDFWPRAHTVYNHPPLIGWYLKAVNALMHLHVSLGFTIRAVSSCADVFTALICFELMRRRGSLRRATFVGVSVAVSPVLFLISGYHGNTDPLFVMFTLLGVWLLADRDQPVTAGAAFAIAISVKIVPVIAFPTVAAYLLWHRRDVLLRTAAGFAAVFVPLWAGPVLTQWDGLSKNVLGYAGVGARQWGMVQLATSTGDRSVIPFLLAHGRTLAVVLSALLPALFVLLRKDAVVECLCFSLVSLLVLSPAFGVQYLAWALAAAYILNPWLATVYNVLAGLFLYRIYGYWNRGHPWIHLYGARLFTPGQIRVALVIWALLLVILLTQVVRASYSLISRQSRDAPVGLVQYGITAS